MWIATPLGFYSAVEHRDDDRVIIVRARSREDLERLLEGTKFARGCDIESTPKADYPYRVEMHRETWAAALAEMGQLIDYPNFKDAVKDVNPDRALTYMGVWARLRRIEWEGREAEEYGQLDLNLADAPLDFGPLPYDEQED